MKHSTKCKILYAIYTPLMILKFWHKGIKTSGVVYSAGSSYFSREKNSTIVIGKGSRFMSKEWGNPIGLNHRCMVTTTPNSSLSIGEYCSFSGVSIRCFGNISIGNQVRVGANCTIISGDAHTDDPRSGGSKPISIEDNVWLGANVMVLKGVTIGHNSLIGAGSVVTKSIPANVIAAGNPCKVIRPLDDETIKKLEEQL